ncbi:MAG TPA: alpha/beta hydrolase [Candidatus Limnocylindrales bacterium]|nr:alpha/beta hydrolase [Candidatus Limnocylindrales bacterium]
MSSPKEPGLSCFSTRVARRLGAILIISLACVALLAVIGACFEFVATRHIASSNPPAGRLVNINGRRTHIFCLGSGTPSVIFISGLGETYASWSKVQSDVARSTRACSYDRAGLGWSDPSPGPRDVNQMAGELHELLAASELLPPYVVVGHSLGGGVAQAFDAKFPQEVAGMILVDSVTPGFLSRMPLDAWDQNMLRTARRMKRLAPFGVARLQGNCQVDNRPLIHCADFWATFTAERDSLPGSVRELAEIRSIGDTPLQVLSRDPDPAVGWGSAESRRAWEEMQEELPKLSTHGRQHVVSGATHYIQDDRPEAVITAISDVLSVVRH